MVWSHDEAHSESYLNFFSFFSNFWGGMDPGDDLTDGSSD